MGMNENCMDQTPKHICTMCQLNVQPVLYICELERMACVFIASVGENKTKLNHQKHTENRVARIDGKQTRCTSWAIGRICLSRMKSKSFQMFTILGHFTQVL